MDYGIYIHIPFCVKKCAYCDFNSFSVSEELKEEYLKALHAEIENDIYVGDKGKAATIFIGGGTPSLLSPDEIEALIQHFSISEYTEITMEANPGTVSEKSLVGYRRAGVNRLSIGVQSFVDEELRCLGRIHTANEAIAAIELAKRAGFENINIDLMKDIPGQSKESLEKSIQTAISLGAKHISAYSLIFEENTPFYEMLLSGELTLPKEDSSADMDELVNRLLDENGYERYEISNYSKPHFHCRHNEGYWQRRPYRGYGLSAASLIVNEYGDSFRFTAESKLSDYLRYSVLPMDKRMEATEGYRQLSVSEGMEEFAFLGLRQGRGIKASDFSQAFGYSITDIYGEVLDKYIQAGFIEKCNEEEDIIYRFTDKGFMVSNIVLADFLRE